MTLIESLIAISLLALSITAITMPFTAAAQVEMEDGRRTIATALAREMMEEILAADFYDPDGPSLPGPESDEMSRSAFDNLDDYDGYAEADGNIRGLDGTIMADPAARGLSRTVTATYGYIYGQPIGGNPTFIFIHVVVQSDGVDMVDLVRLVYDRDSVVE